MLVNRRDFALSFRLEIVLPTKWFKTLHSIGDRFCQRTSKNNTSDEEWKKRDPSSLHPYDLSHKEWAAFAYAKKLEKLPAQELIERLLRHEEQKQLQLNSNALKTLNSF